MEVRKLNRGPSFGIMKLDKSLSQFKYVKSSAEGAMYDLVDRTKHVNGLLFIDPLNMDLVCAIDPLHAPGKSMILARLKNLFNGHIAYNSIKDKSAITVHDIIGLVQRTIDDLAFIKKSS